MVFKIRGIEGDLEVGHRFILVAQQEDIAYYSHKQHNNKPQPIQIANHFRIENLRSLLAVGVCDYLIGDWGIETGKPKILGIWYEAEPGQEGIIQGVVENFESDIVKAYQRLDPRITRAIYQGNHQAKDA